MFAVQGAVMATCARAGNAAATAMRVEQLNGCVAGSAVRRPVQLHRFSSAEDQCDHVITGMAFNAFTEEEKRAISVRDITDTTIYEHGLPKDDGVMSLYLGSYSPSQLCKTCANPGGSMGQCTGHFGLITLAQPVYHPLWVNTFAVKFLHMFCFFCSWPIRTTEGMPCVSSAKKAIPLFLDQPVKKCCANPECGAAWQPAYEYKTSTAAPNKRQTGSAIHASWPSAACFSSPEEEAFARAPFTAKRALEILSNAPAEFVRDTLRMTSRPHDLCIIQSVLVPPTCIRPVTIVRNTKTEQDLTRTLVDIVKSNAAVLLSPTTERIAKLQRDVSVFLDRDVSGNGRKGRAVGPLKQRQSVMDRFGGGKKGRMRSNVMGRRVNNCARFVMGPDALMDIWKLRVPQTVAIRTTREEVVNQYNYEAMCACVRIGTSALGGAQFVVMNDGTRFNLKNLSAAATERVLQRIEYGCIVHRMLRSGDMVAFNRQPTLSKFSTMGHEVEVDEQGGKNTGRASTNVTEPYNLDFDGAHVCLFVVVVVVVVFICV